MKSTTKVSSFHLDKGRKKNFLSSNTSCLAIAGRDEQHCHLVSMVTCCYGNRPWNGIRSRVNERQSEGGEDGKERGRNRREKNEKAHRKGKKENKVKRLEFGAILQLKNYLTTGTTGLWAELHPIIQLKPCLLVIAHTGRILLRELKSWISDTKHDVYCVEEEGRRFIDIHLTGGRAQHTLHNQRDDWGHNQTCVLETFWPLLICLWQYSSVEGSGENYN